MAPKKIRKQIQETMLEEPVEDRIVPPESIGEEEPRTREDHDGPKVRKSNGARSYSPRSNWKSSSR
jgi:hypothetical protein